MQIKIRIRLGQASLRQGRLGESVHGPRTTVKLRDHYRAQFEFNRARNLKLPPTVLLSSLYCENPIACFFDSLDYW
jgi:hypothetical protein